MKILYAIQGTGNGHISRAREILPALENRASVDILISGMHAELGLDRPVKFRLKGLGFKFGKKGGVDYFNTWWKGNTTRFLREIQSLDLSEYDLVINDFEPVSAWAARKQHVPCVGLSNQCVLSDQRIEKPLKSQFDRFARAVLKYYAPTDVAYGFYYQSIDPFISTPVIRKSIRSLELSKENHYVVYLPSFKDSKIIRVLSQFEQTNWRVFSKHSVDGYAHGNVTLHPIDDDFFLESLASATGVICAAGFATTSEVLFLGKKLLVVPMKNQFEQQCNAVALKNLGVPVIKSMKTKWHREIERWLIADSTIKVQYPDNAQEIIDRILIDFVNQTILMRNALELTEKV